MRRNTPPPPKTSTAVYNLGSGSGSGMSKPFASTGPSVRSSNASKSPRPQVGGAVGMHSPAPRLSTAKYFTGKTNGAAVATVSGPTLNAHALAQVKEHSMTMAQRIDQIMRVPKVDARPEMYRIDVGLDEDLRWLHEQQNKRDPELSANPLSRHVKGAESNKTTFNFLDAAEVRSLDGTSCTGSEKSHRKHVNPPVHPSKAGGEKKHVAVPHGHEDGAAPWERSPSGRAQGKLNSPRNNISGREMLESMGAVSASPVRRTNSGKSIASTSNTAYEFVPSLQQLKSGRGEGVLKSPTAASATGKRTQTPTSILQSPRAQQPQDPSAQAMESIMVPSSARSYDGAPTTKEVVMPRAAAPTESNQTRSVATLDSSDNARQFPCTRGASATAEFKPHKRTQAAINKFEASQPRCELPPRPGQRRSATPQGGVLVDLTHDSHFTSFSVCDNEVPHVARKAPRHITLDGVTSPLKPLATSARASSPGASSNPNVLAPHTAPPKRLARSVTPPGGRRGSSGIFDPMTTTRAPTAFGSPKKSLANMTRLLSNTRTSAENTLKSPSLEGKTPQQHATANDAPLRRTMSSLQTSMTKAPDSLKASVPTHHEHVSRKMRVTSPHAIRLQTSDQVSSILAWS